MKISYNWLKELTGLDWSVEEMGERLTLSGTSCEDLIHTARHMEKVVVGEVIDLKPIEGASKIRLATVDTGAEKMDLVCGAPNVAVGQKVPVALLGAKMAGGMVIKKVKIRGVVSCGMICSETELGMSDDHSGILVLDPAAIPGTSLVEHLDYDDYLMEFELTPNRPDSTAAIGIARDLTVLGKSSVIKPTYDIKESTQKASDLIKISIEDQIGCPRYAARVIKNMKVAPSPWWVQKRLLCSGIRPISNIVDIGNLIMIETGNPLHAFDLDQLGSSEILVRRATAGEKFTTLDGNDHELTPDILMITNGEKGVAAAGVMGGLHSEVGDETTTVLLEAAYFNSSVIRKGRKQIGIVSEASTRFEKGVDPNNIEFALNRAAYLFQEICGGEVLAGIVDCYPAVIEPVSISFRPERCNAVLGTDISARRMKEIFTGLEFEVAGDDPMTVTVPTFRPDISGEIDLIEEIVRIEGFDSVPDAIGNTGPLYTPRHTMTGYENELRRLLAGAGFDETLGHGLAHSVKAKLLQPDEPQLRIVNPVSEDLDIMRNTLVADALNTIAHNIAHRNLDLQLFELGKAYFPPNQAGEWDEDDRLMIAVTGNTPGNWRNHPRPHDFYDLTGAIGVLGRHFQWPDLTFEAHSIPFFAEEESFRVLAGDLEIGRIGRVADRVARKFDVKQPVFLAELRVSSFIDIGKSQVEFSPLPVYPAAPRDLALLVGERSRVGDIVAVARQAAGPLAEEVSVFDLYTGKQIEKGKKSVGISITYRSAEGSLSSDEVDRMQQNVMDKLQSDFGAEVRDK